jgi:hypothetical protein
MKVKLSNEDIRLSLDIETPEFPKYVTQILNLANQNAQGTRPKVVGQLSDLIQQFRGRSLPEWGKWYIERNPDAIGKATDKILSMVENLKGAIEMIDRETVRLWVKDLVIVKTYLGLRFQEAILKKGAEFTGASYRLSAPDEESAGIDGYIGETPVSIKPETYKTKRSLSEKIGAKIIYYKKIKDGIEVDYSELLPPS